MNGNPAFQEEWRKELIGGQPVAMAPAATNHNRIKMRIASLFDRYLENGPCEVLPDGEAVYLTETDYYYPDVMIVCDPEKVRRNGVHGAPDLVVEVLSPRTAKFDRGRKKDTYERCGVREYWLVSPRGRTVEQYLLTDGRFELSEIYELYTAEELAEMDDDERATVRDRIKCSLYEDLSLRLADIFARVTE